MGGQGFKQLGKALQRTIKNNLPVVGGESGWETPAFFPQGRIPRLLDPGGVPLAVDSEVCSLFTFLGLRAVVLSTQGEEHLTLLS